MTDELDNYNKWITCMEPFVIQRKIENNYSIRNMLGSGGFANVHLAYKVISHTQVNEGQPVAVKIM